MSDDLSSKMYPWSYSQKHASDEMLGMFRRDDDAEKLRLLEAQIALVDAGKSLEQLNSVIGTINDYLHPYEIRIMHKAHPNDSARWSVISDDGQLADRKGTGYFAFFPTPAQAVELALESTQRLQHDRNRWEFEKRERDPKASARPVRVCLCGSTRFSAEFQAANLRETLAGNIVLTIGCDMRSDADLFADMNDDERAAVKARLDELHLRKIDLADEVLILNVGGYIGESTRRELEYARSHGKRVRFLESDGAK